MTTNCLTTATLIVCNLPPKLWNPAFWMNCVAFHPLILCYNSFLANHLMKIIQESVLLSQGRHTNNHNLASTILSRNVFSHSPATKSLKSRDWQAMLPSHGSGESHSLSSSFWSSKHSLVSGGIIPFSASIFTGPSFLLSLFLKFCPLEGHCS